MQAQPRIFSFIVLMLVFALACGGGPTAPNEQAADDKKSEKPPASFAKGLASTPPHALVGTVTLCPSEASCVPAADGEVVTAWMKGIDEPVAEATVSEGQYHLRIVQRGGRVYFGRTLTFKVGDQDAYQTQTWVSGAAGVLDLVTGKGGERLDSNRPQGSTNGILPPSGQGQQIVEIATNGDTLNYDRDTLLVNATRDVTVKFHNSAAALQHNWVLVQPGSKDAIATAGIEAGEGNSWVPHNDPRVIAYIDLLDGGDSGETNFNAPPEGVYQYVCTFPGHNFTMHGDFRVVS